MGATGIDFGDIAHVKVGVIAHQKRWWEILSETLGSTSVKMMSTPRCYSNKGTSINYVTRVKMLLDEGCGVECIKGG